MAGGGCWAGAEPCAPQGRLCSVHQPRVVAAGWQVLTMAETKRRLAGSSTDPERSTYILVSASQRGCAALRCRLAMWGLLVCT